MQKLFTIIVFTIVFSRLAAQTTQVSGTIRDAETGEPIPFVSVIFCGSGIGTVADINGKYMLKTQKTFDSIAFSLVGYQSVKRGIVSGQTQEISLKLATKSTQLQEIAVKPRQNPAHEIVRQINRHRKQNDHEKLQRYSAEIYTKHQFYLTNLDSSLRNRNVFKKNSDAFVKQMNSDSSGSLPIYFSEEINDYQFQKSPRKERIFIKAYREEGVNLLAESDLSSYIGDIQTNFYNGTLLILDKDFTGPLSATGPLTYRYRIKDTVITPQGDSIITISFTSRNKKNLAFDGFFRVDRKTFAIVEIKADMPTSVNVNYVQRLLIHNTYTKINDTTWFPVREQTTLDFIFLKKNDTIAKKKATTIRSHKVITYKNVNTDPFPDSSFEQTDKYQKIVAENAEDANPAQWDSLRHEKLDTVERQASVAIQKINNITAVKAIDKTTNMLLKGAFNLGYIEIGPWVDILAANRIEGRRFTIPVQTSKKFSKRIILTGFAGYGTHDKKFKFGGGWGYRFKTSNWNTFKISASDNVIHFGASDKPIRYIRDNMYGNGDDNIFAAILNRRLSDKMYRCQSINAEYEYEKRPGLLYRIYVDGFRHWSPREAGPDDFRGDRHEEPIKPFTHNGKQIDNFYSAQLTFNTRLSWDEKSTDGHFFRLYLSTSKPRFNLLATLGASSVDNKFRPYSKIRLVIRHFFPLLWGKMKYVIEAGAIAGEVPYPLLEIPAGNQSFGLARYRFNLMNYMEYANDVYVHSHVEYLFNGLILNYIPLIRRLDLREAFSAKFVSGRLLQKHDNVLDYPKDFTMPYPYIEVGAGVANILKNVCIEYVWRLSDRDRAPEKGAIMARFQVDL